MIDLSEPVRPSLSESEESEVRKRFLILLHSLLLFYLALHNLLIPVLINTVKSREILQDVHFWFLFHLPVHFWLRSGTPVNYNYNLFLLAGSVARLVIYGTFLYSRSWTLVSVLLSELSSLIFVFLIWSRTSSRKFSLISLVGFFMTPLLAFIEIHPPEAQKPFPIRERAELNYHEMGCKGGALEFSKNSLSGIPHSSHAVIQECGFSENALISKDDFSLSNNSNSDVNVRLYELKRKEGRYSWKFIRLIRVEKNQSVNLKQWMKKDSMYLLKSPERSKLGILVIVPEKYEPKGKFNFNFNSIKWTPNE